MTARGSPPPLAWLDKEAARGGWQITSATEESTNGEAGDPATCPGRVLIQVSSFA